MPLKIAYQGEPGANSHIACIEAYPTCEPMPCGTFEDAFQAVADGEAQLAPPAADRAGKRCVRRQDGAQPRPCAGPVPQGNA